MVASDIGINLHLLEFSIALPLLLDLFQLFVSAVHVANVFFFWYFFLVQ